MYMQNSICLLTFTFYIHLIYCKYLQIIKVKRLLSRFLCYLVMCFVVGARIRSHKSTSINKCKENH